MNKLTLLKERYSKLLGSVEKRFPVILEKSTLVSGPALSSETPPLPTKFMVKGEWAFINYQGNTQVKIQLGELE